MRTITATVRNAALVGLGVWLAGAPLFAQDTMPRSSCEVCHSEAAADFRQSIHASADITCVTCHGGDPSDMQSTSMAAKAGFRGKPSRREGPGWCASCHSDRAMMRPYGIGTHQFEDYQSSMHGRAWAKGDTNAATCVDCHQSHRILPMSDSRSSVFPMNVAKTCARCHADARLMTKYGLPTDIFEKYEKSVHAQALASPGRANAPHCATCHGSHAALPPGARDISNVCGQCHGGVKDLVEESPHRSLLAHGKMNCETCHGRHEIRHPTDDNLLTGCESCHPASTDAAKVGRSIHGLITGARERHAWAERQVRAMEERGLLVEGLRGAMEEATTGLQQITRDQHHLDPRQVEEGAVVISAAADDVTQFLDHLKSQRSARRLGLIFLWAYVILTVMLLRQVRHRFEHESGRGEAR